MLLLCFLGWKLQLNVVVVFKAAEMLLVCSIFRCDNGFIMLRQAEVEEELGEENVQMFLEEIQTGKIKKVTLKDFALKCGGAVHVVFTEKENDDDYNLLSIARLMLDRWYMDELHKPGNNKNKFEKILEKVGLSYLSSKFQKLKKQVHKGKNYLSFQEKMENKFYQNWIRLRQN